MDEVGPRKNRVVAEVQWLVGVCTHLFKICQRGRLSVDRLTENAGVGEGGSPRDVIGWGDHLSFIIGVAWRWDFVLLWGLGRESRCLRLWGVLAVRLPANLAFQLYNGR